MTAGDGRPRCSARPRSASSPPGSASGRPRRSGRTSSSTRTPCAASCAPPRCGADDHVVEVGPGPRLADPRPAARGRGGHRRRGRPGAGRASCPRPSRGTRRRTPIGSRSSPPTRCGSTRCPARRPPRWSRTCRTTSRCRCCCTCSSGSRSMRRVLVMVQSEVADRLAAPPGSRTYGVPSVKAAWYADVRRAGAVGRTVFWPAPNVDSGLVALTRATAAGHHRDPGRGVRARRRRLRPAAQDAARRAGRLGRFAARPPRRRCGRPGSTRGPRRGARRRGLRPAGGAPPLRRVAA